MSMICSVLGLSLAQVKALRTTPSLATSVAMASLGDDGDLSQLGPLQPELDLQKSWHILHYLLTGSIDDTSSPGGALLAGEELGEDIGYGPARLLDEAATAEFAGFLQGLDPDRLLARMNTGEMASAGVYAMPDEGDDEDLREEVGYYFPRLRDYVVQVAQKQGGLLTWLS
jgi:hypothetical protein